MPQSLSNAKRKLLVRLESMLGNECYNASIQNYGSGGVREADGRSFRYPLTLRSMKGTTNKIRETFIPASVPNDALLSGYYAFGANRLDVMASLDRIVDYLERHHGLIVDPQAMQSEPSAEG